jgi:3',5'-nucleoside bisphosphate phosphatase
MSDLKRYDLHCHSTASDGSLSPIELIDLAKDKLLNGLCITDHDTLDAYSLETRRHAERLSIELIEGVEISTFFQGASVHVLAYGKSEKLKALINRVHMQREHRNCQIINYLQGLGFSISIEELRQITPEGSLGRPHIADYLVKNGYAKSFREAFVLYLSDEKIAHIKGWALDTKECILEIQNCGALAILAHPHLLPSTKRVSALLDLGLDGLECYYANFRLSSIEYLLTIAKDRELLVTGGSDFHGDFKPFLELAASYTNEEDFQNLRV